MGERAMGERAMYMHAWVKAFLVFMVRRACARGTRYLESCKEGVSVLGIAS
jgi:hypothetical protein